MAHRICAALWLLAVIGLPELVAAQESEKQPEINSDEARDPFGRGTPRSLVSSLVDLIASDEYYRAATYLSPQALPAVTPANTSEEAHAIELIKTMERLLSEGGTLRSLLQLSANPRGNLNDSLPPTLERIGTLPDGVQGAKPGERVELLAERLELEGAYVWVLSSQTVTILSAQSTRLKTTTQRQYWPEPLRNWELAGASVADWLTLTLVAFVGFLASRLFFWATGLVLRLVWRDPKQHQLREAVAASFGPLSLVLAILIGAGPSQRMGVSIVARSAFQRLVEIVAVLALVWFFWRLIDVIVGAITA